jgi:hypothetical protein
MGDKSKVIAVRVNEHTYNRLKIRAIKNEVSVGVYLKHWIDKELYK